MDESQEVIQGEPMTLEQARAAITAFLNEGFMQRESGGPTPAEELLANVGLAIERRAGLSPIAPPEYGAVVKCLVCALDREWGIFDQTTGATVCRLCRDRARYVPMPHEEGGPIDWRAEFDKYVLIMSESERAAFKRGYEACAKGDWPQHRAALSPIARTEIERVRDALRQDAKAGWAKAEQPEADHVAALEYIAASCEANMDALTAVLGAESTKETK